MNLPMKIRGKVAVSKGRGKKLGFPTVNIPITGGIEDGVYIGYAHFDKVRHHALLFAGAAVTFGETERFAEAYILDFNGELYGRSIELEFVKKIRDNKKFDNAANLIAQMKEDEKSARVYFKKF